MNNYIIDVSAHQGQIDFTKVKAAGIDGVMLKCTEGAGYLSPVFLDNYKAAKAAGLKVGAYHYLRAASTVPACKEGRWFGQNVQGLNLELGLALDIEHEGCNWDNYQGAPLTPTAAYNVVNGFAQNVEKYGFNRKQLALYASIDYFTRFLTDDDVQTYRRWLANPSHQPFDKPVQGVQYSWKGKVAGIGADVDLNLLLPRAQVLDMAELAKEPTVFEEGTAQPEPEPEEPKKVYRITGKIGCVQVDLTLECLER